MQDPARPKNSRRLWYWVLFVPLIATAFPQLYATGGPPFIGIPFFYWYQLVWTVLAGCVTGIVYYATR